MQYLQSYLFILLLLVICSNLSRALVCQLNESDPYKVAYTITVDKSGQGNFSTIQSAIDSIPAKNTQWIRIQISPGNFEEKVEIPVDKPCIFLEGAGRNLTSIEFDDHAEDRTSAIFISYPENMVAKGITFKNTYNLDNSIPKRMKRATAARIQGDKSAFYGCGFLGIQDTLYDQKGRHYFSECYIEGSLDFIHGYARSIYERCELFVNLERYKPGLSGCITAQKKEFPEEPSGYVFKTCAINGIGKTHLGRAWGPYSTVIIDDSILSDVVRPEGWDAWSFKGHEANFTYVEANNKGPGADTSKRVPWVKKLSANELNKFLDISYIDGDGWLGKLPKIIP